LSPGGSGYFTCKQNMELVTNKFKPGGLHEKHVVATWNAGKRLFNWALKPRSNDWVCVCVGGDRTEWTEKETHRTVSALRLPLI
jgi:hypothetical protein